MMLLKDVEGDRPLRTLAIANGVQTLEQYGWWIIGYEEGYNTRQKEVLDQINSTQCTVLEEIQQGKTNG